MSSQSTVLGKLLSNQSEVSDKIKNKEKEREEEKKSKVERLAKNPLITRKTIHPKNGRNKLLIRLESMGSGVEKHYFWLLRFLRGTPNTGFPNSFGLNAKKVYKVKDEFNASVSSSFHGNVGSKISAIQQQISTYLAQIGQMTKTIFPIVREIRVMDERMEYYRDSLWMTADKDDDQNLAKEAEIALKSTWIEVVEQGMQNPNSVYSMATKLGFITLPDLFFSVNPYGKTVKEQRENLGKGLKNFEGEINDKVLKALTKKLYQYYTWKQKTWYEMQHTYKFRVKSLKQHFNVIKLYISWLKPLLTNLKQLSMKLDDSNLDRAEYYGDLVSAFESSKLELEILGIMKDSGDVYVEKIGNKMNACLLARLTFVTRPEMNYGPGGQRQPSHMGDTIIEFESYVVTDQQLKDYKEHCEQALVELIPGEEFNMIKDIYEVMNSLGDEVKSYIEQADSSEGLIEKLQEKPEPKNKPMDLLEPFKALVGDFKLFFPEKKKESDDPKEVPQTREYKEKIKQAEDELKGTAKNMIWIYYDVFKKANGLLTP
jgi:hypothetical protein